MGRKFVLVGDIGTDHDGFPPTPVTAGSPTVLIDGKPAARLGDPLAPHSKPDSPPHPRAIAEGSGTILIDGKPAALTGHAVSCGGVVIGSASSVGGESGGGAFVAAVAAMASTASPTSAFAATDPALDSAGAGRGQATNLTMSEAGKQWLMEVEKLRLMPYDDQTGREITDWVEGATIGYGHLISEAEWPLYRQGIDSDQAEQLFEGDLAPFVEAVNESVEVPLAQHQFDAAVMLAYNIGVRGFESSSAVKLINDPEASTPYPTLEEAWKAWNKSQRVVNRGLINRRAAEWGVYSRGVYETW
ncbi:type VI secretion system PAAR protein [Billgrantia antri]|uniref:Lysozyme n=1 Tax=Billgrantia antri TaxID=2846777 RepID=A0ABS6ZR96_9GAMM|nr:type VI secretion system PAAR protein [Halomonas antri]MBW6392591.1 type VI secretion system PAAR protein [Halomonas antri]